MHAELQLELFVCSFKTLELRSQIGFFSVRVFFCFFDGRNVFDVLDETERDD